MLFLLSTLFLLLSLHIAHAQDDTSNITISITKPQPMPTSVPVKNATYVWLSAALGSAPKPTDECTSGSPRGWQGTTYSWSGGTFVDSSGNPTTPTGADAILMVPVSSTGQQNITVTVGSTTNSSCGTRRGSGSKQISVLVVGVKNLQIAQQGGSFSDIGGELLLIPSEKTRLFKAIPDPSGPFPQGKPVWGGTEGSGSGTDTIPVTFHGYSTSLTDRKTVSAECGNTVTATAQVFSVLLKRNAQWSAQNSHTFGGYPIGGPQPYPDPVKGIVESTLVELQADIVPSGLNMLPQYASDFGFYQTWQLTETDVFNSGQTVVQSPIPGLDGDFRDFENGGNLDRDGQGTGNTYFIVDRPGIVKSNIETAMQGNSDLHSATFRYDFTCHGSYKGGNLGDEFHWSITTTVTANVKADGTPDGTFTWTGSG